MVSAIYDGALASAGLKTSQFSVLVSVANRKQVRPAELAKHLQLDESTLSRNVERMCARGCLRLVQDGDRRSHLIEVTDEGLALIRKCPSSLAEGSSGSQSVPRHRYCRTVKVCSSQIKRPKLVRLTK